MTRPEAGQSDHSLWWDIYFAVIAIVVSIAITVADAPPARRITAVAALAGMALVHIAVGRRMVRLHADTVPSIVTLFVQIALFAVAIVAMPSATWMLFAVIPLIFQMAPLRVAIAAVLLVNAVPVVVDVLFGTGDVRADLAIAGVSAASGIFLGLWIVRVVRQSTDRANLIAELEASRAEVERLSHEAGVQAERARLAGEIHDTLAQGFTSIITLVQAADPELRDERLALAVRTAKENLAESRAIVAALSPSALATGLLDAVRRQAARFTEESGVKAHFRTTGEPRDLPTAVEVVLLRAAQEALTNVRRHAKANEVGVLLAYSPASVRVVVRDDGDGFDTAATGGFGLPGMRARAEQVGGTLTVRSDPDTGTTIELEVPA
ncbi:two-component sensor histidine kinase [Actinoplanes ianthinogenes]|uniref:Two-component sensor histidine kinase n=1 Tax=Actinoplanes ianthinogenes TaxID=122358 RepID=A0ABM7LRZ7_9ACTN|nr:sensor histidine kinase [Actinoplanes ianthinogenes]BCJ42047.1 two-component sensor histidine kinase [Actinoplanes ianthinogenes]GGR38007.1 two-component sensor histidine kinase [Actinoplanes ianthinogenes]